MLFNTIMMIMAFKTIVMIMPIMLMMMMLTMTMMLTMMSSGEKSNKCNQCDFASSRAGDLRRHDDDHVDDDVDEQVNLTLLVVAEVTPGLPTTCDVQVSVKVSFVNDENDDDADDDDCGADNARHQAVLYRSVHYNGLPELSI